jgi:hypothetical protein
VHPAIRELQKPVFPGRTIADDDSLFSLLSIGKGKQIEVPTTKREERQWQGGLRIRLRSFSFRAFDSHPTLMTEEMCCYELRSPGERPGCADHLFRAVLQ